MSDDLGVDELQRCGSDSLVTAMGSKRSWTLLRAIAIAIVFIPVLYVSSFGPVCWLVDRRVFGHGLVTEVYKPLFSDSMPRPIRSLVRRYGMACNGEKFILMIRISKIEKVAPTTDTFECL